MFDSMMKKFLYFTLVLLGVVSVCSCSSPEDKAKTLMKEHMNTVLLRPETYECVSVQLDSAFAPYASLDFQRKVLALKGLSEEISKCKDAIDSEKRAVSSAESTMAIYSGIYSDYMRTQYRINKEERDEHQKKLDEENAKLAALQEKVRTAYAEVKTEASQEFSFIGYYITHRYRAKNNAGQSVLADVVCVTDKDFTKVLASYDLEGDDLTFLTEMVRTIQEDLAGNR